MTGAMVCLLAALHHGSNCSLVLAMDGRIMSCSTMPLAHANQLPCTGLTHVINVQTFIFTSTFTDAPYEEVKFIESFSAMKRRQTSLSIDNETYAFMLTDLTHSTVKYRIICRRTSPLSWWRQSCRGHTMHTGQQ